MGSGVIVRAPTVDEFDAFHDVVDVAFHRGTSAEHRRVVGRLAADRRDLVADDGGAIVGTTAAWAWSLSVPGGTLPVSAVTVVTVLPTHRRRGILRAMMARVTADAREQGLPLAALWASEGGIYGRFGYGPASWIRDGFARLPGGLALREPPLPGDAPPLRLLTAEEAAPAVAPIFERARARRPGLLSRSETWWTLRILGDPPEDRAGASPLRAAVVGEDGYALYRVREHEPTGPVSARTSVDVEELVGTTAEAERELLRFVASIDLADELVLHGRPVDDPLPHATVDARAIVTREASDALWLRILDLPAAVAGRSWAAPLDLVLDVVHPEDEHVAGRWRLRGGAGGPGSAAAFRTVDEADVVLHARALASLYLGGVPAAQLRDAGVVAERTPGSVAALDAALRVDRAPWTAGVF